MHFNRQLIRAAKSIPVSNSIRLGSAGRSVGLALRELNSCRDYTEGKSDLEQLLEELEAVEKKKSNLS
ncbi:hypothetical protein LQT97_12770 [Brucella pseudogrignonensis]|uniref:hypothetical protein n=1 Tax=Brucella pseudogrignonensis TaxID=419475 RepID=UPI001E629A3D|nr:hypothetical protein [Brucella pseudogrignonensis]MCD4512102.1 hypothetical protein [Brucella pseudogrignonensis]